jgi:hypothetical protein
LYLVHPIDSWTKLDAQKWIEFCIDEYSLGDVNLNDFEMNGKFYLNKNNLQNYLFLFFSFLSFISKGKALLLLNEDNFKQRSPRSGDILHKALQQHRLMLKSLHCQSKIMIGKIIYK